MYVIYSASYYYIYGELYASGDIERSILQYIQSHRRQVTLKTYYDKSRRLHVTSKETYYSTSRAVDVR